MKGMKSELVNVYLFSCMALMLSINKNWLA